MRRYAIADALWQRVATESPLLRRLSAEERTRLRELTVLFLADKRFFGAHGLVVDDYMRVTIAGRACLLILNLGLDYYRGWRTVVVYPGGFVAEREVEDDIGVVHTGAEDLDGESMYGGAVVLNWEEVRPGEHDEPVDLVVHELAHKLDEANGEANGLPPLHRGMSVVEWSEVFTAAFDTVCRWVDADAELPFDDYAVTDAAEFFSVASEAFFARPDNVRDMLPDVYRLLCAFYRQDPAARPTSA